MFDTIVKVAQKQEFCQPKKLIILIAFNQWYLALIKFNQIMFLEGYILGHRTTEEVNACKSDEYL